MAKMASLHADGVTDLESYTKGRADERDYLRKMIIDVLKNNPAVGALPSTIALQVLAASLSEEEDDDADLRTDSDN